MNIPNYILKNYLKHVYFVTGTAYAGKSSMCKALSEKYDVLWCEENYQLDHFLSVTTSDKTPNLCYFKTMRSWKEFVTRSPKEYADWIFGTMQEIAPFEIVELLARGSKKPILVDTNIPIDILEEISDYNHVLIMTSSQRLSVDLFFNRDDPEKQFLLNQMNQTSNPDKMIENFKECIRMINNESIHKRYDESPYFVLHREKEDEDFQKRFEIVEKHFNYFKGDF